ncbi:MAG: collagen-like protein [Chitinophagaceae bacterium]|nr:collagen-like protein [Chitinophagaceae bacterium]
MDRPDIENFIQAEVKDNIQKEIKPINVRRAFGKLLDWIEFLSLGGVVVDLEAIFMKKSDAYTKAQVDLIVSEISLTPGPQGPIGSQGEPGQNGENGADGKDGADGDSPYIGINGNWWVGETDTGVRAVSAFKTIYDSEISGLRNGVNNIFTVTEPFKTGTLKVYFNGILLSKGNNADFVEHNSGTTGNGAVINRVVTNKDVLIFEYEAI